MFFSFLLVSFFHEPVVFVAYAYVVLYGPFHTFARVSSTGIHPTNRKSFRTQIRPSSNGIKDPLSGILPS